MYKKSITRITVLQDMRIKDALVRLNETGLQIILVCDEESRLAGLLTDGDFRRAVLDKVELDRPVSIIMNCEFTSLPESESHEAEKLIEKSQFNHLPIVDDQGRVVDLVIGGKGGANRFQHKDVPVVIMAGGRGSRLSPLTRILPKPLLPVGEQTMLEKIINTFTFHGLINFKVIINYKKELIKSYFSELNHSFKIEFIEEQEYLGTAGGLRLLSGKIDKTFVLSNCDVVAELDYSDLIDWHREHKAQMTILGVKKRMNIPYGVIRLDKNSNITGVDEKPFFNNVIISGIYVIDPEIIDLIPAEKPCDMDFLLKILLDKGMKVICYPIEDGWFDMGQFNEYQKLLKHLGGTNV